MLNTIKKITKNLLGFRTSPKNVFLSSHYQRHNQRRLEHLASLGLNIAGSTVLEVGAGIGDHTSFFLDRGCQVVTSDARRGNIQILQSRYTNMRVLDIDLDNPPETFNEIFDIVHSYGLLYHLKNPAKGIEFMSNSCKKMLLLETCVSFGDGDLINFVTEDMANPSQAISGKGCRPTRTWVYNQLKRYFKFVYLPITQPNHDEYPIDWTSSPPKQLLTRAVFIAARQSISNKILSQELLMKQIRQ
jgi:hypothetical protein